MAMPKKRLVLLPAMILEIGDQLFTRHRATRVSFSLVDHSTEQRGRHPPPEKPDVPRGCLVVADAARTIALIGARLVRTAGLEPAPGFPEQILSLLRLPFRHVRSALAQPLLRLAAERPDQPLQLLSGGGELFPVDAAQHQRDAEIAPSEIGIGADL